jgi:6-phosphofructokinase 1
MQRTPPSLDFVTLEGLLAYGNRLAQRAPGHAVEWPAARAGSSPAQQLSRARQALHAVAAWVRTVSTGCPGAEAYRSARQAVMDTACAGDPVVFFAAWNRSLAEGMLQPLLRAPIGSVLKPTHRRPVAIVPRAQLTPQLAEGRIVLDLGDERFWLLPRDLSDRTLFFTMRHGVSRVESKTHRVGRRLANKLDRERGVPRADAVGAALARMVGVVGQQLDFLNLSNYLDPRTFLHFISRSPNTRQLFERVVAALAAGEGAVPEPAPAQPLESSDFGWVTGMEKTAEAQELAAALGVDVPAAKRLIKDPLYCYPGGHSFFDLYVDVIDGLHRLGQAHPGRVACLYTHSSTLRALMIYLDPRPFHEAFTEFSDYKESQDNVVLLTFEKGRLSGYSTAVGLSEWEKAAREKWISVERVRRDHVTLKPRQIKRIVALVSGGDFAGAGAALKELRVTGNRLGLDVHFVRHGFLGLANNWIQTVTEADTRGMSSVASSPIGSSRFEDFKDETVQQAAMRHLEPYLVDGALVVLGGDGSLRGARAIYEGFGVQVVGIPGTIDNNIEGTTSLGYHSAIALANQSIESLKATSAAMGTVFFVEVMGAGSGHLALACAYQARAEGLLVNEHPDPDAYIDEVILGTLKRTLGVPNKSHLFVVAERTPHRHHADGGVHGLCRYVADATGQWPQRPARPGPYPLTQATKATILGHTLRGALPTPEDKAIAQHLAYEAVHRLVERPEEVVGCMLAYRERSVIEAIPLHAVAPKQFDWDLFTRMHGSEMSGNLP